MPGPGKLQRRLAAAIVLTALIPLLGAVFLAQSMVRQTSERFFVPEIRARLDEALGLYRELARTQKESLRHQATAISLDPVLRQAVRERDRAAVERELERLFSDYPTLVSMTVESAQRELGHVDRGSEVDDDEEFELAADRVLGDDEEGGPRLYAVFAVPRERFDGLERMSQFVDTYAKIVARRGQDEQTYLLAFAVLLGFAIALAIGVGAFLARGVSRRIAGLADATRRVGAGRLDTRVDESGSDELAELSRAFNRMLGEVEASRARIEYLQRIGAWQAMARRLAHEIKNPLTPIQLAVEEVHRRYEGDDGQYRRLLDASLDVVESEVATLRRLVTEFSDFARLPQARLDADDLVAFLDEHQERLSWLDDRDWPSHRPDVTFELPDGPAPAYLDRQMLQRAIGNLLENADQAGQAGEGPTRIRLGLGRVGDYWHIDIDDDGPGIPDKVRDRLFDPYVTTKETGTGLGLAIVKKIVIEHGGTITVLDSPLGGARFRISLPVLGTAAASAALESHRFEAPPRSAPPAAPVPREI